VDLLPLKPPNYESRGISDVGRYYLHRCINHITSYFVLMSERLVKMDLLEIGLSVMDWIGLAHDRYRWRALVNSVMNLRVP
jgi:hypothetical protein